MMRFAFQKNESGYPVENGLEVQEGKQENQLQELTLGAFFPRGGSTVLLGLVQ